VFDANNQGLVDRKLVDVEVAIKYYLYDSIH